MHFDWNISCCGSVCVHLIQDPLCFLYPEIYVCLYISVYVSRGLLGGSDGKAFACSAGDPGLIPRSGRSPGEGHYNPLPIFARRIPLTEEPGGLQSVGLQTDTTELLTHTANCFTHSSLENECLVLCVYWMRRKLWQGEDF